MAVLGSYEFVEGIRGLANTTVTCNGVAMSPGDSCATIRLKHRRYESWSRAGAPLAPLVLPPDLQQAQDRIMVRDIDAMRALEHDDAGGTIAFGIWLLLPGLLVVGAIAIGKLIITTRRRRGVEIASTQTKSE
ncbi:hypothetical protein BOO86_10050 [Mycobacterium sp. CBMA 234]|uniref:hypothetical protein n=1 Tax=Mycolicibacterium sp. CBMA 234 TaxID=1918495 RepID=UPI0012DBFDC4|nr:hypothetical protein [Mycolicibacterium sp. CBMA 234]MUL64802.1 hypothetical protein [Mycolicibacterium sp. CBMA 234]